MMAEIVIIDKVEDDSYNGKDHKKVTDKSGKTFNVKYGREGKLKAKWGLLVPNQTIEITWGSYQNKPFVQDFKVVEGVEEVAKLEPQPSDRVLPEHQEVIEKARKEVAFDPTRKSIERQTSLKASVEWCIAKHNTEPIKTEMVITVAGLFESYLENGIQVKKKVEP